MKKLNIKGIVIKAAGTGAGAYAAVKVNRVEALAKMKPVMRGVIKLAIGAVLPEFIKDKKMKPIAESVGAGISAVGAIEAASQFDDKLPSLLDAETAAKFPAVEGLGNIPTIGAGGEIVYDEDYSSLPNVAGTPDTMGAAGDDDFTMM